jgi:hypothetical protein
VGVTKKKPGKKKTRNTNVEQKIEIRRKSTTRRMQRRDNEEEAE